MQISHNQYGRGDASFQAAGGEEGIRQLVDSFYDLMRDNLSYQKIWFWHPGAGDKEESRDKLARFLCSWTGGPKRYQEKYGGISIPQAHAHLSVTEVERDMWLNCMKEALAKQDYSDEFRNYLLDQLSKPAEMVRRACSVTQDQR